VTDERLRAAERAGESGGLVAEARLLVERVRAGTFPRSRLELLEKIGDPRARLAAGLDPLPEPAGDGEMPSFEEALAETIVWCSERLALGLSRRRVLRSEELRPPRFSLGENDPRAQLHRRGDWLEALAHVARARRARLDERGFLAGSRARRIVDGRLLFHDPRLQLDDGAATRVSEELFDSDYMPPWDAWIAWAGRTDDEWTSATFDGFLVCWVPAALEPLVQAAIDASPTPTLAWTIDHPFARRLAARGLTSSA